MAVLYKPKFCCNCGEKIDRVSWTPLTSRRFCDVCKTEQKHHELLSLSVVAIGIAAGLFGVSGFMVRPNVVTESGKIATSAAPRPVTSEPRRFASVTTNAPPAVSRVDSAVPVSIGNSATRPGLRAGVEPTSLSPPTAYFCGATTKKGTACSRRVKAQGRCWQHEGQPLKDK